MMSRIGVLGGMFDPIHNGHIEAATFARDNLLLNRVKLIPCSIPNHRKEARCSTVDRVAMLELAIEDVACLEIDPIEINRSGISYTVDTLQELKAKNPDSKIIFILGLDSFNTLNKWHKWEQLFQCCSFFVLARSGAVVNPETATATNLAKRQVDSPDLLFQQDCGFVFFAENFNYELSSTEVRGKLADGLDPGKDLDQKVYSYIKKHKLYH